MFRCVYKAYMTELKQKQMPAVSTFCWIIPRWIILSQKDTRTVKVYSDSKSQSNPQKNFSHRAHWDI